MELILKLQRDSETLMETQREQLHPVAEEKIPYLINLLPLG